MLAELGWRANERKRESEEDTGDGKSDQCCASLNGLNYRSVCAGD